MKTDDAQAFLESVRSRLSSAASLSYAELAAAYRRNVPRLLLLLLDRESSLELYRSEVREDDD